ncbi:hypothetical protein PN441_11115 [Spirulina major CS-329]|uniref:hypothetical protein n=1 Tax=Spirulina TaxID=1154 RepID=UPI00232D2C7A|nr:MULTISPECIES: hypothetical protein [Spirulina]MDB9495129.1 hypothetical protein [Spirulina subsalsa CS-330]MDB9503620.1 hypothetical protein [Spirulina major CS-329]
MISFTWRNTTATLLTATLSVGGLLPLLDSATAQRLPDISRATIPAGTILPMDSADPETEKILLTMDEEEPLPYTLVLSSNVRDRNDRILLAKGTVIEGYMEVTEDEGARFIGQEILVGPNRLVLDGNSAYVTTTEKVKKGADGDDILRGAAIGAAAASVLSVLTGDNSISLGEILGGAGAGALGGLLLGRKSVTFYSVDPNEDLDVTLINDLAL